MVGYLAYLNMKSWKESLKCMKVHCNSGKGSIF